MFGSGAIRWNFTKFLVNRQGRVVGRFGPDSKPEALTSKIEGLLNEAEGV
jgi:glutathione peroxidase